MNKEPKWRHNRPELTTGYDPRWRPSDRGAGEEHARWPYASRSSRRPASSSTCRGTRSRGSSATSASTRRSTSTTARSSTCKSTSSLFRGYSVFMKGKDPRDAHFITSRICGICGDNHAVCSCYAQQHGLRRQAAAAGRVDRQPRRGGRVHLRPHHLPGQPGVRGLLRADGQGDEPERAGEGREDRGAARRHPRLPHDRATSCGRYNPFTGRDVPRGAADEPRRRGRCSA